jgi:hypothetical protein
MRMIFQISGARSADSQYQHGCWPLQDAPRDADYLFSKHRLNVSLSREKKASLLLVIHHCEVNLFPGLIGSGVSPIFSKLGRY